MKIYLAARYGRREEMLARARDLGHLDIEVTSRWLNGTHEEPGTGAPKPGFDRTCALEDLEDIRAADFVVCFTEDPASPAPGRARGGRHVEMGYALGRGINVLVVGHLENVFCHLPGVACLRTWDEALAWLRLEDERPF